MGRQAAAAGGRQAVSMSGLGTRLLARCGRREAVFSFPQHLHAAPRTNICEVPEEGPC